MDRNQPSATDTLTEQIKAAEKAAKAFLKARKEGAPIEECVRLVEDCLACLKRIWQ